MEVAGLHLEKVDLVARSAGEPRGGGGIEALPLACQQRARGIADVVGQDPADQAVGARLGRDERVGLHAAGSGAVAVWAAGAAAPPARLATTRGRPVPP